MHKTWAGRSKFEYTGSVETGTEITYGKGFKVRVTAQQYREMRKHFINNKVPVGTSRTAPPIESLGSWLQKNVTRTAIASYVAPILIIEGYAIAEGKHSIRITR